VPFFCALLSLLRALVVGVGLVELAAVVPLSAGAVERAELGVMVLVLTRPHDLAIRFFVDDGLKPTGRLRGE
jgi:hypothetical protein